MDRTDLGPGPTERPVPVLRVVVVDDQPVVRAGLVAVLGDAGTIEVVAESANGRAAISATVAHRPDVLVLDPYLGELTGEAVIREAVIREVVLRAPETGVLVFSAIEDDEAQLSAQRAGARGYLLKTALDNQIVRAVEDVAAGRSIYGPEVATRAGLLPSRPIDRAEHPFPELTMREREVLTLLAAAMPNPAIARELRLARKTVSNHISNIYAKLGVVDRFDVIMRARDAGLGRAAANW